MTPKEQRILTLYNDGVPLRIISKSVLVSAQRVRQVLDKLIREKQIVISTEEHKKRRMENEKRKREEFIEQLRTKYKRK